MKMVLAKKLKEARKIKRMTIAEILGGNVISKQAYASMSKSVLNTEGNQNDNNNSEGANTGNRNHKRPEVKSSLPNIINENPNEPNDSPLNLEITPGNFEQ